MYKLFTPMFLLLAAMFLSSTSTFAANKITASFGGASNLCGGNNALLTQYIKISNRLRELKANGGTQDEIARHEAALEIVAEGLDPKTYGMTVVVQVDGPKEVELQIPSFVVMDKQYSLASVSSDSIRNGSSKLEILGSSAQVKIEFKLMGICSFANIANGSLGFKEIQNAVDEVIGQ